MSWELRHVGADLGDQQLGGPLVHTGDRVKQRHLLRERGDHHINLLGERLDRLVKEVDVSEDLRHDQRVVAGEASLERFAQRRQLDPQPALRELREDPWVVGARASSIARPDTPSTLDATEDSLIPASWSTLSRRCTSRVRSSICALR